MSIGASTGTIVHRRTKTGKIKANMRSNSIDRRIYCRDCINLKDNRCKIHKFNIKDMNKPVECARYRDREMIEKSKQEKERIKDMNKANKDKQKRDRERRKEERDKRKQDKLK